MAHLTDMEELLAEIVDPEAADYMREAMSCYMAGAYRACIVLSYIALFDDLVRKVRALAPVNADAKTIATAVDARIKQQDVFENYLIDQLRSHQLVSELDASTLDTIRNRRNKSAHPSGHHPSAEEARFVFRDTIGRFLSKPVLSTTQLAEQLLLRVKNPNFFPTNQIEQHVSILKSELAHLHDAALPFLVRKLVELAGQEDGKASRNAVWFLAALAKLDEAHANEQIIKRLLKAKADEEVFERVILTALSANGRLFFQLDSITQSRIRAAMERAVDGLDASLSLSALRHPVNVMQSLLRAESDDIVLSTVGGPLISLLEADPYHMDFATFLAERTAVFERYFEILLSRASSSTFSTANNFAKQAADLQTALGERIDGARALQLLLSMMDAAETGAWTAKSLRSAGFSVVGDWRSRAVQYAESNSERARQYVTQICGSLADADGLLKELAGKSVEGGPAPDDPGAS